MAHKPTSTDFEIAGLLTAGLSLWALLQLLRWQRRWWAASSCYLAALATGLAWLVMVVLAYQILTSK